VTALLSNGLDWQKSGEESDPSSNMQESGYATLSSRICLGVIFLVSKRVGPELAS